MNKSTVFVMRKRYSSRYSQEIKSIKNQLKIVHKLINQKQYQSEPKQTFQELGLAGLSEACNYQNSVYRRLIWGILWCFMWTCCIFQCVVCLEQYLSNPTSTSFSTKKIKTITPPCVTFCPYDITHGSKPAISKILLYKKFGNVSYDNPYHLLTKTGMDVESLWNISNFTSGKIKALMWQADKTEDDFMEEMELVTVIGVCRTFKPLRNMPCTGKQAELQFSSFVQTQEEKFNSSRFMVLFHSVANIPVVPYYGPDIKGLFMQYEKTVTVSVTVKLERYPMSGTSTCISEEESVQCEADCFDAIIRKHSNLTTLCRLPFMKDNGLPLCRNATEFRQMHTATKLATEKMIVKGSHCLCPQPCENFDYYENYVSVNADTRKLFDLRVFLGRCKLHIREERFSYLTANLISDVGGILGICLGMSILSIVGIFETLISKLFVWITSISTLNSVC